MPSDDDLADRVRSQLEGEQNVTERTMFGRLCFFVAGNMAVGISGEDLMVRVGPEGYDDALAQPHARVFDMSGRAMAGWVVVGAEGIASEPGLAQWISRGVAFARSLPPKG
jgi:TfoX/Sxy family transcriptional regulator of competence genes